MAKELEAAVEQAIERLRTIAAAQRQEQPQQLWLANHLALIADELAYQLRAERRAQQRDADQGHAPSTG